MRASRARPHSSAPLPCPLSPTPNFRLGCLPHAVRGASCWRRWGTGADWLAGPEMYLMQAHALQAHALQAHAMQTHALHADAHAMLAHLAQAHLTHAHLAQAHVGAARPLPRSPPPAPALSTKTPPQETLAPNCTQRALEGRPWGAWRLGALCLSAPLAKPRPTPGHPRNARSRHHGHTTQRDCK